MAYKINKTDKEWREILTPEQYRVLRQAGTERAFSGKYNDHYEEGAYVCAACGSHLGHVFDDGPAPAHRHFCINSAALDFRPAGAVALRKNTAIATFAAGCFWGIEEKFRRQR